MKKFRYGNPVETGAMVVQIEPSAACLPYLEMKEKNEFTYPMEEETIVYGLGENVRGINKRGFRYVSCCSDDPDHNEAKESLYGAHNFLIVDGRETFGIFVDYPAEVVFDIGFSDAEILSIQLKGKDFDLYILEGKDCLEIVRKFRTAIGTSYIPPRWAMGYGQSRWSYNTAEEVEEVVDGYRSHGIPLDSVYMDIDYMERYKDFTIDQKAFPEFPSFVERMKSKGIHLVPIIDAGVKIEKGYDVYEEGVEQGFFCKNEDGTDFVAGVWPGRVHFPDVLNQKARAWFGNKYKVLLDQGIDGFWNDMNEPAIFYSEERLQEVLEAMEQYKGRNLDLEAFWEFRGLADSLANNGEDYKRFYHNMNGKIIRHDKVHNLYGYKMTQAAAEEMEKLRPDERILLFSRASYIGMHRYGGIWTGDNMSIWSHLLLNIKMMPSLNMCGFLFTGADIGGFGANTSEELMLRWLAFGIFTPLMRNHSAIGTRRQELYQFAQKDTFKNLIELRYGLMPYLYSEYMKCVIGNDMLFKPLGFVYKEDRRARRIEDQLLVGESIMIAPVYEQNALGRYVYLPERMKMIIFQSISSRKEEILEKGDHYIEVSPQEVVLFLKENCILPLSKGGQCMDDVDFTDLEYVHFVTEEGKYKLYCDDGISRHCEEEANITVIEISKTGE